MRKDVQSQIAPSAEALYDAILYFVDDLENDVYDLEELFVLIGQTRAFLEENFELEVE